VHFPFLPLGTGAFESVFSSNQMLLNCLLIDQSGLFAYRVGGIQQKLGRAWFHRCFSVSESPDAPPLGFHLLMGDDFRAMASNQLRNLEENRIALIEVVARKSV